MSESRVRLIIGAVVIFQAALLLIPQAILGSAIDWPDSLDFAPSKALPLVADNLHDVRWGYGIYLIYSIAWVAIGPAIAWLALGANKKIGPLFITAIGLICASALARAIGIIRWLTASTYLAETYTNSSSQEANTIEIIQNVVNSWGGAIGEILGVSLFTVGWLVAVSILVLKNEGLPRWIGWLGFAIAPILASPVIELFGLTANIFVSTLSIHIWLFAVGIAIVINETKKVH